VPTAPGRPARSGSGPRRQRGSCIGDNLQRIPAERRGKGLGAIAEPLACEQVLDDVLGGLVAGPQHGSLDPIERQACLPLYEHLEVATVVRPAAVPLPASQQLAAAGRLSDSDPAPARRAFEDPLLDTKPRTHRIAQREHITDVEVAIAVTLRREPGDTNGRDRGVVLRGARKRVMHLVGDLDRRHVGQRLQAGDVVVNQPPFDRGASHGKHHQRGSAARWPGRAVRGHDQRLRDAHADPSTVTPRRASSLMQRIPFRPTTSV
jgi:hypothetical protein